MWNDREEGQRFKLYHQLYLLSGQVLDESLVKGSQRQQDRQTALIASHFVLLISILTAAPAPGGATRIWCKRLHVLWSASTGTPVESSKPLYQIARSTSLRFMTSRDAN